ncbi:hypothetical protein PUNSTDRAFT_43989 [Punctularia strigosozonata HHB-11173 SS5]|uniref:uncharacterized protein n=1 Tax=Punctularia strigosozonata (strain HHB-11173) TaxID=741275 RepID=UPI0004417ADE|nr:uncharacterized protein PUNSTDRAFT_43989 [Punctularia strigosozonata HHB-11173 SS5]EIN09686.1 hypothetical protein PUNSTDRAFT_43989 [Punctularia strigosozonata HHB-11173 SS5]
MSGTPSTQRFTHVQARTQMPRPPLPIHKANRTLLTLDHNNLPPVKFQKIKRPEREVLVGRMKIPTPNSHAFILRRYDTGAISITTMFRAAFPTASDEEEKAEMAWIKANYDTAGANGGGASAINEPRVRFAGTWASADVAMTIAGSYAIDRIVEHLARAHPSPDVAYRSAPKSGGGEQVTQLPTPQLSKSDVVAQPPPAKRRKEASSPVRPAAAEPATPAAKPPSRRSTRLSRSPAPATLQTPQATPSSRLPRRRAQREEPRSDQTDNTLVDDEAAQTDALVKPTMLEDIQEQRELIEDLMAQRQAEQEAAAAAEEEKGVAEEEDEPSEPAQGTKRAREEEDQPLQFNFKEPAEQTEEVTERAIVTNRRVGRLAQMSPRNKQVAWGALAFAAGLGAVSFLPNFFF